jgi:hypothetical protein
MIGLLASQSPRVCSRKQAFIDPANFAVAFACSLFEPSPISHGDPAAAPPTCCVLDASPSAMGSTLLHHWREVIASAPCLNHKSPVHAAL